MTDLIRRDDALAKIHWLSDADWTVAERRAAGEIAAAIASLPAVTVGVNESIIHRAVLDWIREDASAAVKLTITPEQVNALSARILAVLEPAAPDLSDPVTVHANMLRGTIAKPTVEQIIHLYGVDALAKALAPVIVREAGYAPAPDAVKIIQKRIETIVQEEGSWEPDTNVTNLPEWAETAVEELEGILAALTPTPVDASQPADPVVNAGAIREAALREAEKALRNWQDSLNAHRFPHTAITVGMSADVVFDLIPKGAAE